MEDPVYATQQILRHITTLDPGNEAECLAVYSAARWFEADLRIVCKENKLAWGGGHSQKTHEMIWHLKELCRLDYPERRPSPEAHRYAILAAEQLLFEIQSLQRAGHFGPSLA